MTLDTAIPAIDELQALGQRFVCWRWENRDGKLTKPPIAADGRYADSTNPGTWMDLGAAMEAAQKHRLDGIGFELDAERDGIVGIDLDGCRNAQTGKIADWATRIIRNISSYTEISPSGTGAKIYCRADPVPKLLANKRTVGAANGTKPPGVEIYTSGRYFCLTGQIVDGVPDEILDSTEALERLAAWIAKVKPAPELPAAFQALLERDAKLRDAWENGTKIGSGGDTSASGLDWSLARYLRPYLDDSDIAAVLRLHPHGQIGGGKLKGKAAERRIENILAELPIRRAHEKPDGPDTDPANIPLTPAAWMARNLPPPDYLMGDLFSTTARVQISADTGLGKSMLGLAISVAMRLERNFLHWTARRAAKVLVIDGEMPGDLLKDRIRVACSWFGVDAEQIMDGLFILSRDDVPDMSPLDTEDGHQWLFRFIDKLSGVDFVVFDNCMALTVGDLREETTWRSLVPLCRALSVRKVGQLWLHHVGHDKSRAYGSRIFTWQMDAEGIGEAVNDNDADVSFKLTWKKSRRRTRTNRADFATVTVKLIDGVWSHELEGGDAIRGQPSKLNAVGTIAVDALTKALAATGARPPGHDMTKDVYTAVTLKQWRAYFKQVAGYGDDDRGQDAERKAFGRGKENVLAIGRAKVWGEWAWLA